MRKILTAILVLVLSISAFAEITQQSNDTAKQFTSSNRDVLYDQSGDPSADGLIATQNFVDPTNDPYDTIGADDFVVPAGETWTVDEVLVVGGYWGGTGPITAADIFFYADNGGMPGDVMAAFEGSAIIENGGIVTATLATPLVLTEGTYWMGYAGVLEFAVGGQCGWQPSNGPHGNEFYWINAGGGFGGSTDWTAGSTQWPDFGNWDLCFAINGTVETGGSTGTVVYEDDMEAYTAGTGLVAQSDFWNNWSNGGAGDDAMVTDAQASSGANSFVVEGSSDIIALFDIYDEGQLRIGSDYMVGAGMGGYFNLLHDFTEYRTTWAVEFYFASDGTGYLSIDGAQIPFAYNNGVWFSWDVLIDMDADTAEFSIDGTSIHTWQWSLGASAGTSDIRFQASNFYAAAPTGDTAQYFVDDFFLVDETPAAPATFEDDMEAYTAGTGLVAQSEFWNNWSNGGAGDDAMVTTDQASSGVNSFVVEGSSDIIAFFDADGSGSPYNVGTVRLGSQYMVGAGMGGYFNLLHDFTEYRTTWAVEAYFASDGTGYLSIDGAQEAFTYTNGAWFGWEVLIDMDADTAEFFIDGVSIHAWQWSLGASAGTSDIRFQAQNFYAAAPTGDTAQYFVDDYYIYLDNAGVVGINDTQASVSNFELNQNYPNPFNPTTSISFSLENNSNVQLAVFDAKGALVANLVNGNVNSGAHSVEFNAAGLSTGVYYYTLNVNNISTTKKMMLLK